MPKPSTSHYAGRLLIATVTGIDLVDDQFVVYVTNGAEARNGRLYARDVLRISAATRYAGNPRIDEHARVHFTIPYVGEGWLDPNETLDPATIEPADRVSF